MPNVEIDSPRPLQDLLAIPYTERTDDENVLVFKEGNQALLEDRSLNTRNPENPLANEEGHGLDGAMEEWFMENVDGNLLRIIQEIECTTVPGIDSPTRGTILAMILTSQHYQME